jgi:hypothetical protein
MLKLGSFLGFEDSMFKGLFFVKLLAMALISMMSIVT